MLEDATPETFQPHVGTVFTVHFENAEPVELTLVDVRLEAASPGQPRQEPFTLRFESGQSPMLDQRTYSLRHDSLGALAVFLVPSAPGVYEAVFN